MRPAPAGTRRPGPWLALAAGLAWPLLAPAAVPVDPSVAATTRVDAVAMLALAKSSGCLACHAVQQTKVGPAYAAIAARDAHKPGALETLQDAILHGESGTWGIIPMPAYGGAEHVLSRAQARDLAQWILGLAPHP